MATLEPTVERRDYEVPLIKRTAWGALLAGTAVALAVMVLLATLGIAIGAGTIDPATGDTPGIRSLGVGAGIWWLVTGILALLAGGWTTGRLAGYRRRLEGPLHGIVTWALTGLVTVALLSSALGALIGGAVRIVGATMSVAVDVGGAVGGAVVGAVPGASPNVNWQRVQGEAREVLKQTGKPELRPKELREDVRQRAGRVGEAVTEGPDAVVDQALIELREASRDVASAADKEALVNVLVARTNLSRDEASEMVDRWAADLQQGWQAVGAGAERVAESAQRGAVRATEAAAHAVSAAAWWTFFYFLLTAGAAALGGWLGSHAPARRGHGGTTITTTSPSTRATVRTDPVVPPQAPPTA